MQKYSPDLVCPKCGQEWREVTLMPMPNMTEGQIDNFLTAELNSGREVSTRTLMCACLRCKERRNFLPIDAADDVLIATPRMPADDLAARVARLPLTVPVVVARRT